MPSKQHDSSKYQKLSDIEHVLHAPDTYIGSIEQDSIYGWTFNKNMITYKQYNHISGLYKIFDEALVNARDHYIRMKQKKESGYTNNPNFFGKKPSENSSSEGEKNKFRNRQKCKFRINKR